VNVTIKKKWKLQRENPRLAGAVISTQQQPAVLVMKFFAVVSI
jgi:hypothetical protein